MVITESSEDEVTPEVAEAGYGESDSFHRAISYYSLQYLRTRKKISSLNRIMELERPYSRAANPASVCSIVYPPALPG